MKTMQRWKFSALAAAAVASVVFHGSDAYALALGRAAVQSALGEPLRAEIELPQITAAEAESLRAGVAAPEVFRAQGLEYAAALSSVQVRLQRRADGTMVLRLNGDRPVNEPFMDLVLDTAWNAGRVVRSYTLLFDPPATRRASAAAVAAAPQVTMPLSATMPEPARMASGALRTEASPPKAPRPVAAQDGSAAGTVIVQPGDTASRLANAHRPAGVSLDQMLVALMRANPGAFIQGDINRIKAGASLQIPDESAVRALSTGEGAPAMTARSQDFGAFRNKLAATAPAAPAAPTNIDQRSAAGSVQTRVDDKKATAAALDKLTLSTGTGPAAKPAQEPPAAEPTDPSTRMMQMSKNISDLGKISEASSAAQPGASAPAADAASGATASDTSAAPAPSAPAPEPAPAPAAPAAIPAAPPKPEPSAGWFASLMDEQPWVPMVGGGLLALLAGYGLYSVVQRRRQSQTPDTQFMDTRLQADTFLGTESAPDKNARASAQDTVSAATYSPSPMGSNGDVDPVAEADVYLAYGREQQAVDILRESLLHDPHRIAVHMKLAEIYASRKDAKALGEVARTVKELSQGIGADWDRITKLGQALEPTNPLYALEDSPASAPAMLGTLATGAAAAALSTPAAPAPAPQQAPEPAPAIDMGLQFDLSDLAEPAASATPTAPTAPAQAEEMAKDLAEDLAAVATPPEPESAAKHPVADLAAELDFGDFQLPDASDKAPAPVEAPAEPTPSQPPAESADLMPESAAIERAAPAPEYVKTPEVAPIEFDFGDLSLDLEAAATPAPSASPAPAPAQELPEVEMPPSANDPMATKLALAEEFNAIGDVEGARELIQEVAAQATGALKEKAERRLAELA